MELQGTRVDGGVEAVWDGEPGCYCPILDDDGTTVKALWFKLPSGSVGRIAAIGFGNGEEPEWEIGLNPDATVSVSPSIEQHAIERAQPPIPYWHGHLRGDAAAVEPMTRQPPGASCVTAIHQEVHAMLEGS